MKIAQAVALALALVAGGAAAADGPQLFRQCAACHLADGAGIPSVFPPLRGRLKDILSSAQGREYVSLVVIKGLIGTITIDGESYVGAMPAQGLGDEDIARVINYAAAGLAGAGTEPSGQPLRAAEVAAVRAKYAAADNQTVLGLRKKVPTLNVQ